MNSVFAITMLFAFSSASFASDFVLPYRYFGPQCLAYELIGQEWWQWDSVGDGNPKTKYPIKVVIYWNQSLDKTKLHYPVDQKKKKDFRYIKYSDAISYLEKSIHELKHADSDLLKTLSDDLQRTLVRIQRKKTEQGAAPNP